MLVSLIKGIVPKEIARARLTMKLTMPKRATETIFVIFSLPKVEYSRFYRHVETVVCILGRSGLNCRRRRHKSSIRTRRKSAKLLWISYQGITREFICKPLYCRVQFKVLSVFPEITLSIVMGQSWRFLFGLSWGLLYDYLTSNSCYTVLLSHKGTTLILQIFNM
jgi:hypothetical protein